MDKIEDLHRFLGIWFEIQYFKKFSSLSQLFAFIKQQKRCYKKDPYANF